MKLITLYFIFFLGHGIYFSSLGPSVVDRFPESAGLIFMAGQLALPVGYFFTGYISDRYRLLRSFLVVSLILHAPVQYFLFTVTDPLHALFFSALSRFFFAVNFQLIAIAVLEDAGNAGFGTVRAWGTAGFLAVQFSLFAFSVTDPGKAAAAGSLLHLFTVLPALFVNKFRISQEAYDFRSAVKQIRQSPVILFFFLSFMFHFSFNIVDFYLGSHLKNSGGMPLVYGGWALAVLLEIPFLNYSARLVKKAGQEILLGISLLAGILRFTWLGLDSAGLAVVPVIWSQLLHGLHFTGFYMGAILFLRSRFSDHVYGTAYGIYMAAAVAFGSMTGSFVFGEILKYSGFTAMFVTAAAVHAAVAAGTVLFSINLKKSVTN